MTLTRTYDRTYDHSMSTIFLGGGCFWCLEGVFQNIHGITSITSGYMNGQKENPK
jgi:peptide-methionine (S)-S-oxide reductase